MEKRVIIIVGPTCSGKTKVSIDLAQKLNTEVISSDSRQIFKLLNIGTAKPSQEELLSVQHHFIDYLNPDKDYNASLFENDSLKVIDIIQKENKIPIVVGGSGLYVKALVDGITESADFDLGYRQELNEILNNGGKEELYRILREKDPQSADSMLPQNYKRIIRALEVLHVTGKPIWSLHENYSREINKKFIQFGLHWERNLLYERIENRVDEMISNGLVNEVSELLKIYDCSLNSLNTVGYKEIIMFLNHEISLARAIELIKRNTRRYAKRQMTWFRKDERINWIKIQSDADLVKANEIIFSNLNL